MLVPIEIRLSNKLDLAFITDSWYKAVKYTYPNQFALSFQSSYLPFIKTALDQSVTIIAHLESEPEEIVAYLTYTTFRNNKVVLFAYTKVDARKQGILNKLLSFANPTKSPIIFTTPCKNENTMSQLCKKYIFDPTIIDIILHK